jgi:hypothetical protein
MRIGLEPANADGELDAGPMNHEFCPSPDNRVQANGLTFADRQASFLVLLAAAARVN